MGNINGASGGQLDAVRTHGQGNDAGGVENTGSLGSHSVKQVVTPDGMARSAKSTSIGESIANFFTRSFLGKIFNSEQRIILKLNDAKEKNDDVEIGKRANQLFFKLSKGTHSKEELKNIFNKISNANNFDSLGKSVNFLHIAFYKNLENINSLNNHLDKSYRIQRSGDIFSAIKEWSNENFAKGDKRREECRNAISQKLNELPLNSDEDVILDFIFKMEEFSEVQSLEFHHFAKNREDDAKNYHASNLPKDKLNRSEMIGAENNKIAQDLLKEILDGNEGLREKLLTNLDGFKKLDQALDSYVTSYMDEKKDAVDPHVVESINKKQFFALTVVSVLAPADESSGVLKLDTSLYGTEHEAAQKELNALMRDVQKKQDSIAPLSKDIAQTTDQSEKQKLRAKRDAIENEIPKISKQIKELRENLKPHLDQLKIEEEARAKELKEKISNKLN